MLWLFPNACKWSNEEYSDEPAGMSPKPELMDKLNSLLSWLASTPLFICSTMTSPTAPLISKKRSASEFIPVSSWTRALKSDALVFTFIGLDMYTTLIDLLCLLFLLNCFWVFIGATPRTSIWPVKFKKAKLNVYAHQVFVIMSTTYIYIYKGTETKSFSLVHRREISRKVKRGGGSFGEVQNGR